LTLKFYSCALHKVDLNFFEI